MGFLEQRKVTVRKERANGEWLDGTVVLRILVIIKFQALAAQRIEVNWAAVWNRFKAQGL
jgi:hypothetical protein